jgi:diaminohydroxyphosphoribosylaminopyrimidine deaminase/5-amino-6-(5-phosphoribosylamino)uracil reductase
MLKQEVYMKRCLELATLGIGSVSPNPMVGAVIVHNDEIIGEGWHQKYGQAHAEVNAINDAFSRHKNAAELLKESTIYISLEPCSFHGKTPACSDLIIHHGIPNVVIACLDPNEKVNGLGVKGLEAAGIKVSVGLLKEEAIHLNRRFNTRIQQQRPYIILKWAETADGYFAPDNGSQHWISGLQAKQLTHRWRSEEDAILVGKNTARIDNPKLTTRLWSGKNPKRVVLDKNLELPSSLHLFDQKVETIVLNLKKTELTPNLKYISLESFDYYLAETIAYQLYLLDIQSVIIEGGAKTLNLFIKAGLWDEARVFKSKNSWKNGIPAPILLKAPSHRQSMGKDSLTTYFR